MILSVLRSRVHLIWLCLSLVLTGTAVFVALQMTDTTWTVLFALLFITIYGAGCLAIASYLQLRNTNKEIYRSRKIITDVAGTVGRAAPLIRSIESTLRQGVSMTNATNSEPQTGESDFKTHKSVHEAASLILAYSGLTVSTRASMRIASSGHHLLVVTRSNWPIAAVDLGLITEEEVTATSPEALLELPVSLVARKSVIVVDQPCLNKMNDEHFQWLNNYLRWTHQHGGIYFTDSTTNSGAQVKADRVIEYLDCVMTRKFNLTVAFPAKGRFEDYKRDK